MSDHRGTRQSAILDHLVEVGTASARDLADLFAVSVMTVHRDLDELVRRGTVRKFHGGVSVVRTGSYEIAATIRRRLAVADKLALGRAALELVSPGQTVVVDDSTTVATMLPALARADDLRVVTNSLPALTELTAGPGRLTVHAIGGTWDAGHDSFLGTEAVEAASGLRTDLALVSTTTLDADGLYHQEESSVALKRAMLRGAHRRVLLADGSKVGHTSLFRVGRWDLVDDLLVAGDAPSEVLDAVRAQDVRVTVVDAAPDEVAG